MSPRGQITAGTYGNGLGNTYHYAATNGQMFDTQLTNVLYDLDYQYDQYDQYGNLQITYDGFNLRVPCSRPTSADGRSADA